MLGTAGCGTNLYKAGDLDVFGLAGKHFDEFNSSPVFVSDDDTSKDMGTFLQERLTKNLGAEVKVTAFPFDTRHERTLDKDYQNSAYSWIGDYNDPVTFMDL